jgi:lipopolysaccharide/colanic/teichoic acid biosynthesis glycosyltransferase
MRLHGISRDAFDRYVSTTPAWYYEVVAAGFKYNLTDIASAIGIEQLRKIDRFQQRRQQMAQRYDEALAGLPLLLPPQPSPGSSHAWHLYVVRLTAAAHIGRDELITQLSQHGIGTSVHFIPLHRQPYWRETCGLTQAQFPVADASYLSMLTLPLYTRMSERRRPAARDRRRARPAVMTKRAFDLAAAVVGLTVLAPLFVVIALWIRFDSPGPVFFRQQRVGRHGVLFNIFKFRTMTDRPCDRRQLTVGRDPRITGAGHFLRRYKLDELPQLLNVIQGTMSLVGPRPEVPRYVACYPPKVRAVVLSVAPGITDWASIDYKEENAILGRAANPELVYIETILPQKLEYYQRYVRERTFWLDLRIIWRTLVAIAH